MIREEAVHILQLMQSFYPKFALSREKGDALLPVLKEMDYEGVKENLFAFVAAHAYPPTIAEIAAYPKEANDSSQQLAKWREEARQVPEHVKGQFKREMEQLLKEKKR